MDCVSEIGQRTNAVQRCRVKIVQGSDPCYDRSERLGDGDFGRVCNMAGSVHHKLLHPGAEGLFHLSRSSAEVHRSAASRYTIHHESPGLKPGGDSLKVALRGAKADAKFFRREPLLICGRG